MKYRLTVKTLILCMASLWGIHATGEPVSDTTTINISASVDDAMVIEGLEDVVQITGTQDDLERALTAGTGWEQNVTFKVRRQGASNQGLLPYRLRVEGQYGGDGQNFYLLSDSDRLNMNIRYQSRNSGNQGFLNHDQWSEQLNTELGINTLDPETGNLGNITLGFVIPEESLRSARGGTYQGEMTVRVSAM